LRIYGTFTIALAATIEVPALLESDFSDAY